MKVRNLKHQNWFPRPNAPADIFNASLTADNSFSSHQIFEMLRSESAVEWRDKVGVFPPADGAEKSAVRLLKSGEWLFKTSASHTSNDIDSLLSRINESIAKATHYKLWHADKFWFVFHAQGTYWACSACPRLKTLRQLKSWDGKMQWWAQMLLLALKVMKQYKISLKITPSNFGYPDSRDRLYYLDDDVLPLGGLKDLGEALSQRIPEESSITAEKWHQLGLYVKKILAPHFADAKDWGEVIEGAQHFLLSATYHSKREALIEGLLGLETLSESISTATAIRRSKPVDKVCVFADVHGNLPALEAVLREAKQLGVGKYIFLGDAVGLGPHPRECVQRIGNLSDVIVVQGNYDNSVGSAFIDDLEDELVSITSKWSRDRLHLEEISWLLKMPLDHTFDELMIVHGSPTDPVRFYDAIQENNFKQNLDFMKKKGLRVLFYGHTHIPHVYRQNGSSTHVDIASDGIQLFKSGEMLLLNPGSVGQPRDGDPRASFAIWDLKSNVVDFHRIQYSVDQTISALQKMDLPDEIVFSLTSRLETGR